MPVKIPPQSDWKALHPRSKTSGAPESAGKWTSGVIIFLSLGLIMLALGLIGALTTELEESRNAWLGMGAFGAMWIAVVSAGFPLSPRRLIASWKLDSVEVKLKPDFPRCGEEIQVQVWVQTQAAVTLTKVGLTLEAFESTLVPGGEDEHVESNRIHKSELNLAENRSLKPGEHVTLKGSIVVPSGGPPTFVAKSNQILWYLRIEAHLLGWPDWKREFPVIVVP